MTRQCQYPRGFVGQKGLRITLIGPRAIYLLVALLALTILARGTTLTGTLKNPDGSGANGNLIFTLAQQAALSSAGSCGGPATIVPTVQKIIAISGGTVPSTSIYGNDCLLPQGTYYNVQFNDTNGNTVFTDRWVIQGTSIDIGTIVSVVISGTTQTLGGIGVVQTTPIGNQTVTQPLGSVLSLNYLAATGTFQFPQGNLCDTSGCNGMTFKTGVLFNQGLQTVNGTNSLLYVGTAGQLINRTWSGFDASCMGVADGFQGVRTDNQTLQMCIGGVKYQVQLQ